MGTIPAKTRFLQILRWIRNIYRLFLDTIYDFFRYVHFSDLRNLPKTQGQHEAFLVKKNHALEKGMTLSSMDLVFAERNIVEVVRTIRLYRDRFGLTQAGNTSVGILERYLAFYKEHTSEDQFIDTLEKEIAELKTYPSYTETKGGEGGVVSLKKEDVLRNAKVDLSEFFASRYSIRDFSEEPVADSLVRQAVELAKKTPSVCNRQAWRVYALSKKEEIQAALSHQNGNSGFNEKIHKLLIVVCDIEAFAGSEERYQQWIDGGMFSMSLIYALHSLGLGTCALNWSRDWFDDIALGNI